ncbi:hypothetical protein [Pelomonas sp. KK5]|uniref:hypothetical protein n=1 Tax=Pelomonas sp. KK5 TaxID=1855730 RepID=UPI00097C845B|nr:hypothetical protein [Pelomonas sp. KK5]
MKRKRRTASIGLATLLVAGCGGGGIGEDIGNAFGCALSNCKESNTVSTDNVSPRFTVTQQAGVIHVDAWLSQSANLLTTLMPSPGDSLTASDGDAAAVPLRDSTGGQRMRWERDFNDAGAQPRVTINFVRNGTVYPNTVSFPRPIAIAAPTGTLQIRRSAGTVDVALNAPDLPKPPGLAADASCSRSDHSSFTATAIGLSPLADETDPRLFHLSTLRLDDALNQASVSANQNNPLTAPVASCTLKLVWTVTQNGTVDAALNQHGWIIATRSVNQAASYDATR